jgi:hypothetical protein
MRTLVVVAALMASGCSFHKSDLKETFEWMDNTYNAHENIIGAFGHGRAAWYTHTEIGGTNEEMVWGESESFTHKGCDLTLKIEDNRMATTMREVYSSTVYRFNLRDIDPSSVKVEGSSHLGGLPCAGYTEDELRTQGMNCDHADMMFTTGGEAGLIDEEWHTTFAKLTGDDHENHKSVKAKSAHFVFDDLGYAQRFGKAFRHAVELCGGKASPF